MTRARRAAGPGAPAPGREDDLRDILALLDYHRVVVVTGGRGVGRSTVLQSLADLYGVERHEGVAPQQVERGDLIVLDDARQLTRRQLAAVVRKVLRADGRLLIGSVSATLAPKEAVFYRLRGLPIEAAAVILRADSRVPERIVEALAERVGGHAGMLASTRDLLAKSGPKADVTSILGKLAEQMRGSYQDVLTEDEHRSASLLVAAGGWLPAQLDVGALCAAAVVLVREGLAEFIDGALEATPVLLVSDPPPPPGADMQAAIEQLRGLRPLAPAMVRLAEANLLRTMGQSEEALAMAREGHRYSRGSLKTTALSWSLLRLASAPASALQACARLGLLIQLDEHHTGETLAAVKGLIEEGHLAPPDIAEARTYIAFVTLGKEGAPAALRALGKAAEQAAASGDGYAEAQALLWQAWIHILGDAHQLGTVQAHRAARLAKKVAAPVLQARALHCLSRADLADGDMDAANRRLRQALRLTKRHRLDDDQTIVLDTLAELAGRQGRPSEAAEYLDAADVILERAHNLPRKGKLAVTRAEVALRRGHIASARRILASADVQVTGEPWHRDILAADVAVASADYAGAASILRAGKRHPIGAPSWLRRRALIAAALLREGVDPQIDLEEIEADELAALVIARGRGELAKAAMHLERLERAADEDDQGTLPLLLQETIAIRLLQGRIEEAAEKLATLRERLATSAASTGSMLLLEGIEHMVRGEPLDGARRAVWAHRSATFLGHERVAGLALELLASCHLALGRERGLQMVLRRGDRLAAKARSPTRSARMAALRIAAQARFGLKHDIERSTVLASPDPLAAAFVRRIDGESLDGPLSSLTDWLHGLLVSGTGRAPGWASQRAGVAIELTLDQDARNVVLAGGKRVPFRRRRVLWRLLSALHEADGQTIEPSTLYMAAWDLPFNQSRLNSLYVGVRRLRLLVEPDPSAPRIILAGPNGGYYMDVRRVGALERPV